MFGVKTFELQASFLYQNCDSNFPSEFRTFGDETISFKHGETVFGFVKEGEVEITYLDMIYKVPEDMYFSIPGKAAIKCKGRGFLASRLNYMGMFMIGGPIEHYGRLKYIDGCSDTLLISPVLLGDPCMNYLFVPPDTNQTAHTHPSVRIGLVIEGEGECRVPNAVIPLIPGNVFCLEPDAIHSFHTFNNYLRIIVYHPDSDFGPSHENHPMLNRSYVKGQSVSQMHDIRTKEIGG